MKRAAAALGLWLACCGIVAVAADAPAPATEPNGAIAAASTPAPGTTFDTGPELATRLLHNVVRIDARDLGEHGFGLVVGVAGGQVYIVTARHVVARRPPAGIDEPERASAEIAVGFCALAAASALQPAEVLAAFDGADADLALLRTGLPAGYLPQARALAPVAGAVLGQTVDVKVGEPAWQLGRERDCALQPTPGLVASPTDARQRLRIDLHGVLGGSSGGPVAGGRGVVGITLRSDNEKITVHDIADVQRRVRAVAGAPFTLVDARNIPPGDPQAAVIDLTETLRAYLFGVRDLQALLRQDVVPRPTFAKLVGQYGQAVERFRSARDKHDGTLIADWPPEVMPEWAALRDALWKIHLVFFRLNGDTAKTITVTERSPPSVQQQMAALEPELVALEAGIDRFATDLGTKGKSP